MSYVISVLSVLKTGHAFLPLPIDYPDGRITFTLQDSDVYAVITTKEKASTFRNDVLKANVSLTEIGIIWGPRSCYLTDGYNNHWTDNKPEY